MRVTPTTAVAGSLAAPFYANTPPPPLPTHTYVHKCTLARTHTRQPTHTHTCTHVYTHPHTYTDNDAHRHAHTHSYTYALSQPPTLPLPTHAYTQILGWSPPPHPLATSPSGDGTVPFWTGPPPYHWGDATGLKKSTDPGRTAAAAPPATHSHTARPSADGSGAVPRGGAIGIKMQTLIKALKTGVFWGWVAFEICPPAGI